MPSAFLPPTRKECNYMIDTQRLLKKFNYRKILHRQNYKPQQNNLITEIFTLMCVHDECMSEITTSWAVNLHGKFLAFGRKTKLKNLENPSSRVMMCPCRKIFHST
jgi:hypothetical protein